jgi:phosphonate transport system ATP-binding protein
MAVIALTKAPAPHAVPVSDFRCPADSPGCSIAVDGLRVARGGRDVLADVSARFETGAVTVVVGRSGVGKSTLISVLNGLVEPSRGAVSVRGLGRLEDKAGWAQLRRQTATIFQDHALIGRLTAIDNVLLGLADQRHPLSLAPWSRAARDRAAQSLADVGMLDRAMSRVELLSGGERQRIGIARALTRRPRLLLGDEPFSALDLPLARQLGHDLRALATRDGVTVVLVLHQIALARVLADRIVGLNEGRIAFDGPAELFDAVAEREVFSYPPASEERKIPC